MASLLFGLLAGVAIARSLSSHIWRTLGLAPIVGERENKDPSLIERII
jgi:hypothetical protein